MDPLTLLFVGAGTATVGFLVALLKEMGKSETERTRDEVRRIGDTTINEMRRTSNEFRKHIDRETRRR
jgi:hypothetical protein